MWLQRPVDLREEVLVCEEGEELDHLREQHFDLVIREALPCAKTRGSLSRAGHALFGPLFDVS